jgi:hypothetical protein
MRPLVPSFSDDSAVPHSHRPTIFRRRHENTIAKEHGQDYKAKPASCFLAGSVVGGISGCTACEKDSFLDVLAGLSPKDSEIATAILESVEMTGPDGLRPQDLLVSRPSWCLWLRTLTLHSQDHDHLPRTSKADIVRLAQVLLRARAPLLFWAGYDSSRLVHFMFVGDWTVAIPGSEPFQRVAPRYWIDIRGQLVPDAWRQSVNLVRSLVMHQPGVTEVSCRHWFPREV